MQVGELFVSLGVKGSEKTLGAIGGIKDGMKDLSSFSLEAKAAIFGAIYAFERLMSNSGKIGTQLTNLAVTTGLSARTLQQYQYAAQQAGVANEEVTQSFTALQEKMQGMRRGESAPAGRDFLTQALGGNFDQQKIFDTQYVTERLNAFAQLKNVDQAMKTWVLGTFGWTHGMVAAAERGKFSPDIMNRAPLYSDRMIAANDRANVSWMNLGQNIQMAFGKFNAAHGEKLVQDITKLTQTVIKFTESLLKLGDSVKIFDKIGMVFQGWGQIFGLLNDATSGNFTKKWGLPSVASAVSAAVPFSNPTAFSSAPGHKSLTINQTNHIETTGDPKENAYFIKKETENATRSLPQGWAN